MQCSDLSTAWQISHWPRRTSPCFSSFSIYVLWLVFLSVSYTFSGSFLSILLISITRWRVLTGTSARYPGRGGISISIFLFIVITAAWNHQMKVRWTLYPGAVACRSAWWTPKSQGKSALITRYSLCSKKKRRTFPTSPNYSGHSTCQ